MITTFPALAKILSVANLLVTVSSKLHENYMKIQPPLNQALHIQTSLDDLDPCSRSSESLKNDSGTFISGTEYGSVER